MIKQGQGSIFDSGCDVLVNPVNGVGVMGAGLAKEFKKRFPKNFLSYACACDRDEVIPGRLHVFRENDVTVVNFPTKLHWRDNSVPQHIEMSLYALAYWMGEHRIKSIAVPALGCGFGGLEWFKVKPLIEDVRGTNETAEIVLYGPQEQVAPKFDRAKWEPVWIRTKEEEKDNA